MTTIIITQAAYDVIKVNALATFTGIAERREDGSWLVPVSDEVFDVLMEHQRQGKGANWSEIIMRAFAGKVN